MGGCMSFLSRQRTAWDSLPRLRSEWAASRQNQQNDCAPSEDYYVRPVWSESSLYPQWGSVRVAERLALPTSDHEVTGSNPAEGEILPEPKRRFLAQSLSCSPFHRLEMTEILLKGHKTLTHPSIKPQWVAKDPSFLHADREDSHQTGRMPRLIWVFAGRTCHFVGFVVRGLRIAYGLQWTKVGLCCETVGC